MIKPTMTSYTLYLQHITMRFNLLFYGVPDGGQTEDTEVALSTFLEKEIDITDAPVQVTHRLGPYSQNQKSPKQSWLTLSHSK